MGGPSINSKFLAVCKLCCQANKSVVDLCNWIAGGLCMCMHGYGVTLSLFLAIILLTSNFNNFLN